MLPDYPHKLFADKRNHFELLMETLAMTLRPTKGGLSYTLNR